MLKKSILIPLVVWLFLFCSENTTKNSDISESDVMVKDSTNDHFTTEDTSAFETDCTLTQTDTTAFFDSEVSEEDLLDVETDEEVANYEVVMPEPEPFCGMESYEWLSVEEMGKILNYKKEPLFSLKKELLENLLKNSGFSGIINLKYDVNVYVYEYQTQDRGSKVKATSVIGFPVVKEGDEQTKFPVILWLHGTSGFMNDCAPSKKEGGKEAGIPAALFASMGYIFIAPDYIGLNSFEEEQENFHPYLAVEPTAIASLDALRGGFKLLSELEATARSDGRIVLWGGSQGGHAVFAVDLYAPYYAPEFNIVAGIALVPPTDLKEHAKVAVSAFGPPTVALAGAITALTRWHNCHDKVTIAIKNEEPLKIADLLVELMDSTCNVDEEKYQINEVNDVYTQDFINYIKNDQWDKVYPISCVLKENSITETSITRKSNIPILFVTSENDELVTTSVERKAFLKLCDAGYKMQYIECKGASHTQGAYWSLKEQLNWLEDRFSGKGMEDVCKLHDPVCCSLTDKGPCVENDFE